MEGYRQRRRKRGAKESEDMTLLNHEKTAFIDDKGKGKEAKHDNLKVNKDDKGKGKLVADKGKGKEADHDHLKVNIGDKRKGKLLKEVLLGFKAKKVKEAKKAKKAKENWFKFLVMKKMMMMKIPLPLLPQDPELPLPPLPQDPELPLPPLPQDPELPLPLLPQDPELPLHPLPVHNDLLTQLQDWYRKICMTGCVIALFTPNAPPPSATRKRKST
ncbi:hypothetical protein Tco_1337154 [Tanacetum coccineum]